MRPGRAMVFHKPHIAARRFLTLIFSNLGNDKATATVKSIRNKKQTKKNELEHLVRANNAISYKQTAGYSAAPPQTGTSSINPKNGTVGAKNGNAALPPPHYIGAKAQECTVPISASHRLKILQFLRSPNRKIIKSPHALQIKRCNNSASTHDSFLSIPQPYLESARRLKFARRNTKKPGEYIRAF